ncbi:segregation/condensation protein A, partial [Streptomyces beijiangensis]|nr:segregation/condensation protein A [Streptomyces beijiangensis]
LELYRERAVALEQEEALGDLVVRWSGGEAEAAEELVSDEFDQGPQPLRDEQAQRAEPDAPEARDDDEGARA